MCVSWIYLLGLSRIVIPDMFYPENGDYTETTDESQDHIGVSDLEVPQLIGSHVKLDTTKVGDGRGVNTLE